MEKEQERVISERPTGKATHIEHVTWAKRNIEAEKKRKKAEENAKRVHYGVRVGGGWEGVEGKVTRMVEVTTHFTTLLIEEQKKSLPKKNRVISDVGQLTEGPKGWECRISRQLSIHRYARMRSPGGCLRW